MLKLIGCVNKFIFCKNFGWILPTTCMQSSSCKIHIGQMSFLVPKQQNSPKGDNFGPL